jgi:DNA modification methylase
MFNKLKGFAAFEQELEDTSLMSRFSAGIYLFSIVVVVILRILKKIKSILFFLSVNQISFRKTCIMQQISGMNIKKILLVCILLIRILQYL